MVNVERRFTHGGILAALIDLGADWAMVRKLGRGVPTIDMRVDYHAVALAGRSHHQGQGRPHGRPVLDRPRRRSSTRRASCSRAAAAPISPRRHRRRRRDDFQTGGRREQLIAASIFAVLPALALAADNPDWAYPVTPQARPLDSVHSEDAAGQQQEIHAGADRRSVQSARLVSRRASADAADRRARRTRARGRACAQCHLTSGDGHPESSSSPGCRRTTSSARWRRSRTASARASAPPR